MDPLTQKLAQATWHTHQMGLKWFTTHIIRFPREIWVAPKEVYKWLHGTGEGDRLGLFILIRGWGWAWSGGSPLCGPGLDDLNFPPVPRTAAPTVVNPLLRCKARGGGLLGPENSQQINNNGVRPCNDTCGRTLYTLMLCDWTHKTHNLKSTLLITHISSWSIFVVLFNILSLNSTCLIPIA